MKEKMSSCIFGNCLQVEVDAREVRMTSSESPDVIFVIKRSDWDELCARIKRGKLG